ncbi:hypothetical protein HY408_02030 [Candidatus Gottesmanbacteria bacterium]|nr:hypothetical protein [Candidatus Gottesmanbacteria bacterium]
MIDRVDANQPHAESSHIRIVQLPLERISFKQHGEGAWRTVNAAAVSSALFRSLTGLGVKFPIRHNQIGSSVISQNARPPQNIQLVENTAPLVWLESNITEIGQGATDPYPVQQAKREAINNYEELLTWINYYHRGKTDIRPDPTAILPNVRLMVRIDIAERLEYDSLKSPEGEATLKALARSLCRYANMTSTQITQLLSGFRFTLS